MNEKKRGSFTGQFGFIMAAAASAVGLGNIWRFPYLAAKNGGGTFILVYLILTVTFGFTLLTTEIAIGRKTKKASLAAYGVIHPKWNFLGKLASLVPVIILPYYCSIGGWIFKYLYIYITGQGKAAVQDEYFSNYIGGVFPPILWMLLFFFATALVVFLGVDKGIEKSSRILMPILVVLIVIIAGFSLTLKHTDETGALRTGLQGLKVYLVPNFEGMTVKSFFALIMDAMGQLFFSISVAMGIMVTYGSYVKKETNIIESINHIEIFDTAIAFLAGMMIIPTVYTFMGTEGMSAGPGLIFVSLPKVFDAMGTLGYIIAPVFFIMVSFAAVTSSVSVMETVVASIIDVMGHDRKKSCIMVSIYTIIVGVLVCLGYNVLNCNIPLLNGSTGQILDLLDYVSNTVLMPIVALLTSILIGWGVKPKVITDEVTDNGERKFGRQKLYIVMIKYVVPVLLILLIIQSVF